MSDTNIRRVDAVDAYVSASKSPPLTSEGMASVGIVTMPNGDRFVSLLLIAPNGNAMCARISPRRLARLVASLMSAAVKSWGSAWMTAPRRGSDPRAKHDDDAEETS